MKNQDLRTMNKEYIAAVLNFPVLPTTTYPLLIDDCSVKVNFAVKDTDDPSPSFNANSFEQALMATYDPSRCTLKTTAVNHCQTSVVG